MTNSVEVFALLVVSSYLSLFFFALTVRFFGEFAFACKWGTDRQRWQLASVTLLSGALLLVCVRWWLGIVDRLI